MKLTGDVKITFDLLKKADTTGIHSFELNRLVGTTRSAARIRDLKDLGYIIQSKPERLGDAYGVRYTLTEGRGAPQKHAGHLGAEVSPAPSRESHYEFDNETGTARLIESV